MGKTQLFGPSWPLDVRFGVVVSVQRAALNYPPRSIARPGQQIEGRIVQYWPKKRVDARGSQHSHIQIENC
jgi:hypothetical protein